MWYDLQNERRNAEARQRKTWNVDAIHNIFARGFGFWDTSTRALISRLNF
jgi:hypothetical protein